MGLLALGTPLPWSEAKKHADYVREHGIEQLLHIWDRLKDRTGDRLLWGDEVRIELLRAPAPISAKTECGCVGVQLASRARPRMPCSRMTTVPFAHLHFHADASAS